MTNHASTRFPRAVLAATAVLVVLAVGTTPAARADSIVTADAFVPAVKVVGATGTFVTDVFIFNPDPTNNAEVYLYFTPADTDGTNSVPLKITPDLAPRETVTLADILGRYFGENGTFGLLEVQGSVPLLVTSNTYNVAGALAGTYGQYSPGQPYRASLGFDDSVYGNLYVAGLPNDPNYRVNAAIQNPTKYRLYAGVQLVDAVGFVYGTRTFEIPPFSQTQLNDVFGSVFASFGPPRGDSYRLNFYVDVNNGARILSYATITDTRTGDPYLVPGQAMVP